MIVYQIAPQNVALDGYKKRRASCATPRGALPPPNLFTVLV